MGDIAYQNKDIASKVTADHLVGKSLAPFGLPDVRVLDTLPTNLPVIESNELRLDHLFLLEDGSVGIIDYESVFTKENFVKYMNYVARIMKRYAEQNKLEELKHVKVLIIYTADVEWAMEEYDLGGVSIRVEASYLVNQDTDIIYQKLHCRIGHKERLTEEELAQLMLLPLTVKGKTEKQRYIEKAVKLAKQIPDREQSNQVLAGILTFCDKVIEREYAEKVKEELQMTLVEQLIFADGVEAGVKQGIEQGIEQGIRVLIEDNMEEGTDRKRIIEKLICRFHIAEPKAEEYLLRFAGKSF